MTIKSIKDKYRYYSYEQLVIEVDTINDSIEYLKEKINELGDAEKDAIYLKSYNAELKELNKMLPILIKFLGSAY